MMPSPRILSRRIRGHRTPVITALVALIAIGIGIGVTQGAMGSPHHKEEASPSQASPRSAIDALAKRDSGDPAAIGDLRAPVVIVEYADFTCKYCSAFAVNTLPALLEDYVETGKVRIEWRDAAVLSEDSVKAAIAARAAGQQRRFWQYYDQLYDHTFHGTADFSPAALTALAGNVPGLDQGLFTRALADPQLRDQVLSETAKSRAIGVGSVPAFIIGNRAIQGAQPVTVFREIIDEQLARTR